MELFIISGYLAICIVVFTVLRIPLNRRTVPTASISGLALIFALIQLLNFYHPHSDTSGQFLTSTLITNGDSGQDTDIPLTIEEPKLVAWFPQNNLRKLQPGSEAEVTFDGIPGKVFSGLVQTIAPIPNEGQGWARHSAPDSAAADGQTRIPVLIDITDSRYPWYVSQLPHGSRAQSVVYGSELQELALVRQTLLRMTAWMNYLTPIS